MRIFRIIRVTSLAATLALPLASAQAPSSGRAPPSPAATVLALPSSGPKDMCDEIRRALADRQKDDAKLAEDKAELARQKDELDKLAEKIRTAHDAVKKETARLELLTKQPVAPPQPPDPEPTADADAAREIVDGPRTEKSMAAVADTLRRTDPKQAAKVIEELAKGPRGLASALLLRIPAKAAGAIIDNLDPGLAAELLNDGAEIQK